MTKISPNLLAYPHHYCYLKAYYAKLKIYNIDPKASTKMTTTKRIVKELCVGVLMAMA
jgi:hypothetical protein